MVQFGEGSGFLSFRNKILPLFYLSTMDPSTDPSTDPERLLQCPYDKNHQIRACRLPYHLVKCKENNKKIAKELVTCPYNARHRIPRQELTLHLSTCESKMTSELEGAQGGALPSSHNKAKEVTESQCPPSQEDWEADAEEAPGRLFVFGTGYVERRNPKSNFPPPKGFM